jgi:prophage tail gpP-like protein
MAVFSTAESDHEQQKQQQKPNRLTMSVRVGSLKRAGTSYRLNQREHMEYQQHGRRRSAPAIHGMASSLSSSFAAVATTVVAENDGCDAAAAADDDDDDNHDKRKQDEESVDVSLRTRNRILRTSSIDTVLKIR